MTTAAAMHTTIERPSAGRNCRFRWMSAPAMVIAPRPARANWARDSCPAHPVRIVTEMTMIAISAIRE